MRQRSYNPKRAFDKDNADKVDRDEEPGPGGEGGAKGPKRRVTGEREKRQHCAPYDGGDALILNRGLRGAEVYYEIIGKCQCIAARGRCDCKQMLRNKYTPWTRFPLAGGGMFCEKFVVWVNPYACRAGDDVRKSSQDFLREEVSAETGATGLVADYRLETDERGRGRWMKLWYAVDRLHAWAHHEAELDEETLKAYTRAFYWSGQHVGQSVSVEDVRSDYWNAGLLRPERADDWEVFRNCRDGDLPDFVLNPTAKDALMHYLLAERRKVVRLFEKVVFLKALGGTLRRLEQDELPRVRAEQAALVVQRQQEEAAAGAAWAARKLLQAAAAADRRPDDERDAAEGLVEMSRGGGGGGGAASADRLGILLQCLLRLA